MMDRKKVELVESAEKAEGRERRREKGVESVTNEGFSARPGQ